MTRAEREAIKQDLRDACYKGALGYMTSLRGITLLNKGKIVAPKGTLIIRVTGKKPGKKQQHFEISITEKR